MLEEQLEVVHRLLTEDRVSFRGEHYTLEDATFLPKPVQRPRPPLIVGGKRVGSRMRRLIGRWVDEFNTHGGTPQDVRARFQRARAGCVEQGRDPDTLVTSLMTWIWTGRTEAEWRGRVERSNELDPLDMERLDVDYLVGTPDRIVERIQAYAAHGVQRLFLNHDVYDDLEMLELVASEILPQVS